MANKILILGASGYIGNALYKELTPYFDVYGTYLSSTPTLAQNQVMYPYDVTKDSLTNMDIFHAIEASAHKFKNPDGLYGYGIPNFAKANLKLSGTNPTNVDESELFDISPNPFSTQISGTFYSSAQQTVVIRLVNSLGQEVRRIERNAQDYNALEFTFSGLQSLTQGMYTLHIESGSGKYYQKMVKLRE